jgi:hypothetical protein
MNSHFKKLRMKKIQLLLLFIPLSLCLRAQSLTPFVVSASGSFFTNGAGMLSSTTGELAAVTTLSAGSNILTQGFQQAWDFSVSVPEIQASGFAFDAYPNPSSGVLTLALNTDRGFKVNVKVYDALGKTVYYESLDHRSGYSTHEINLTSMAEGLYLLEVTDMELASGKISKSVKKINIAY